MFLRNEPNTVTGLEYVTQQIKIFGRDSPGVATQLTDMTSAFCLTNVLVVH